MSKKKFSEGLDNLLNDLPVQHNSWGHATDAPVRERKSGSKNFMDDLDELFLQALDESLLHPDAEPPAASTPGAKSKSTTAYRAPLGGLDTLIRQTINIHEINVDETDGKKRFTISIDKSQFLKLKTIARHENAYLKDIMVRLINEYIQEYTAEKRLDL